MTVPEGRLIHISSAVVTCRHDALDRVRQAIGGIDLAEVMHAEAGKLVVVIEGATRRVIADCLARISLLEGVMAAALVYEQAEPADSLGKEA